MPDASPHTTTPSPGLFAVLASGSRGNAFYVGTRDRGVLVEAGLCAAEIERRLARLGLSMWAVEAVLLTHEHGDHVHGLRGLLRTAVRPIHVYASRGTLAALAPAVADRGRPLVAGQRQRVAGLDVRPCAVPHDAREPLAYRIDGAGWSVGFITDLGRTTRPLVAAMQGVSLLYLEANHDPAMLADGPYPPFLKERIRGGRGHASNLEAARFVVSLGLFVPRRIVLGHLSSHNNRPELARAAMERVVSERSCALEMATQDEPQMMQLAP